jgi:excisionase family DNA binding protein
MRALLNSSEHVPHRRANTPTSAGGPQGAMPLLLTVDDAAELLRTTKRAIYAMVERRQLPGIVRINRRVLFRADDLLHWLDQKRAPLPKE